MHVDWVDKGYSSVKEGIIQSFICRLCTEGTLIPNFGTFDCTSIFPWFWKFFGASQLLSGLALPFCLKLICDFRPFLSGLGPRFCWWSSNFLQRILELPNQWQMVPMSHPLASGFSQNRCFQMACRKDPGKPRRPLKVVEISYFVQI